MADFTWAQILVPLGTATIGLLGGVKLSRYQFELSRQRSEKQAAFALREDLRRLDANLGESANAFGASYYGMTFEPPRVHRWSEPIIVQLAAADPRIVSGCMALDRELANFSATVALFRLAYDAQQQAEADSKRLKETPLDETAAMGTLLHQSGARVNAERRVTEARESVADAIRLMRDHHTKAKAIIAPLLRHTSAIADAPEREFMQLPEEMPRLTD